MKKMTVLYLVAVLTLLSVSVVMVSCKPRASVVPDGFAGVPWGANKDQIKNIMGVRGYRQNGKECIANEKLYMSFSGEFAGVPCGLLFSLIDNSFHEGEARYYETTQTTFNNIVDMLSRKYGPPSPRKDTSNKDSNGKDHTFEYVVWDFVDNKSSDEYRILVSLSSSNDNNTVRYDITVYYSADSLAGRLRNKEY